MGVIAEGAAAVDAGSGFEFASPEHRMIRGSAARLGREVIAPTAAARDRGAIWPREELQALARAGFMASHRGVGGGFALARDGKTITVADVVTALEGPIALTACLSPDRESCTVENSCPVKPNWERLNDAVRTALQSISVAEMVVPRFPTTSTSRLQGGGNGAMAPAPSSVGAPEPR